jgi:hypothetical protein
MKETDLMASQKDQRDRQDDSKTMQVLFTLSRQRCVPCPVHCEEVNQQ